MSRRGVYTITFLVVLVGIYLLLPTIQGLFKEKVSNSSEAVEYIASEKFIWESRELGKPVKPEVYKKTEEEEKKTIQVVGGNNTVNKWWSYPSNIKETTRSGDDLLVLVNKEYKLPSTYAPKDLVHANTSGIRVTTVHSYQVRSIIINDLKRLNEEAKKEGINLSMISGYRAYGTQANTYNYWVNVNGGNIDVVDQISARPGHSQHQLGTTVDFSSSEIGDRLGSEFDNTKASKWLEKNAWKYGFVISYPKGYESTTGYSYESWHYRYIGRENAKEMVDSGKILEVWLRGKN